MEVMPTDACNGPVPHSDCVQVGAVELQIISPIGQGGNGIVYKGLWRGIGVDIKRIVFQDNAAGDKKRQVRGSQ